MGGAAARGVNGRRRPRTPQFSDTDVAYLVPFKTTTASPDTRSMSPRVAAPPGLGSVGSPLPADASALIDTPTAHSLFSRYVDARALSDLVTT
jgi:hypothetical protein